MVEKNDVFAPNSDPAKSAEHLAGCLAASKEWRTFVDSLAPLADQVVPLMADPQDPLLRREMYRLMVSQISMAYFGLFLGDSDHPDFWPLLNQAFNIFGPNPDMYYFQAPIEGGGTYKISGFRGTSHIVDFQVAGGQFYNSGTGRPVGSSGNYDLDDLHIESNGYFEVLLSNERPEGYAGNWWRTYPDTTNVHVRQISYDWLNEVDARFVIERLDRSAAKPRMPAERIDECLKLIPQWAENWIKVSLNLLSADRAAGLINKVTVVDFAGQGGTHAQKYVSGQFDLQPDEALLVETDLPEVCPYWSFVINDLNYSVMDYANRQSSINGHQAHFDSDGRFRIVISATDPRVPNWLDTVGHQKGAILGRWRDASSAPLPSARKIKVAEVRNYLPADTPVITPEMRDAAIRIRSKGARLRRRW